MFNRETASTRAAFERLYAENPGIADAETGAGSKLLVAGNVMRLRVQRGMTQKELAEALGVSQPRVAQIESARANPRLDTLDALARVFGVETVALLEPEGTRQKGPVAPPEVAARA